MDYDFDQFFKYLDDGEYIAGREAHFRTRTMALEDGLYVIREPEGSHLRAGVCAMCGARHRYQEPAYE